MGQQELTIARVTWRLIPLLIAAYLIAYLDRVNVSFAAVRMNADLGLSAAAYGFGAGVFFLTYTLFEVPSNIILARVGARRWIARIMFTWGVLSGAMAFVDSETSFYIVRALLGIAEAGFFPGVVYYLSLWFPAQYRARISSYFMIAIPLSTVIGSPLSGLILNLDGALGFKGWQWLFVIEAIPAVVMSAVVWFFLTDRPADAQWLTASERAWLQARLDEEQGGGHHTSLLGALKSPRVLALGLVCFGAVVTNYGVSFFLPQIIAGFGASPLQTGFIAAIPYVVGAVGMVWWGRHSDAGGERKIHTAIAIAVAAAGLVVSTFLSDPTLKIAAISVAGFGMFAYLGPFWAIPSTFLNGPALAAGIAAINSIANIAGFAGPYIIGYLKTLTGNFETGLIAMAAIGGVAILIVLGLPIGRAAGAAKPGLSAAE